MTVRLFLPLFVGGVATLSLLSCRDKPTQPGAREVASLALVVDSSTSSGDGVKTPLAELRCAEVAGLARESLRGQKRVDVLVLATGGTSTGGEPRVLVPWLRYAPTLRQFGGAVSKEAQAEAFLATLGERCRSTLVPENSSPIVAAARRGVESLNAHCTELASRREVCSSRQMVLVSDLRETVDRSVKERLVLVSKALRRGQPLPSGPQSLTPIGLGGTHLRVCGLSEHTAGKDDLALHPEALTRVWGELFNGAVTFEAACPRQGSARASGGESAGGAR